MDDSLADLLRRVAHSPEASPRSQLPEGTHAGDYRLLEIIGRGGFGTVYRAVHPVIGKEVAIKVLDGRADEHSRLEARFVAEARAVNRINHQNIVDIFGFGELDNGQKFYVMELLTGQTLSALIKTNGALSMPLAMSILEPLADALDAAHQAGILHRDLKPANVFLQQGPRDVVTVKLLDFGVAKVLERSETLTTRSGAAMGTPAYMAPEQSMGESVGPAADIYALGAIAYEALTGTRPFSADNARALLTLHLFEPPVFPSLRNPRLPSQLDAPLLKMLAKLPSDRPLSAREAIRALSECCGAAPSAEMQGMDAAAPVGMSAPKHLSVPAGGGGRPRPTLALQVGLGLLAACALGTVAFGLFGSGRPAAALGSAGPSAQAPPVATMSAQATTPSAVPTASSSAAALASAALLQVPEMASNTVWLELVDAPARAVVYLGKQRLGAATERLSVPKGVKPIKLRLENGGHAAQTITVTPNRDHVVRVSEARSSTAPSRPALPRNPAGELEY